MADEKSKNLTDSTGPDTGPAPVQPEVGGGIPEPKKEQVASEKKTLGQAEPTQPNKAAIQKEIKPPEKSESTPLNKEGKEKLAAPAKKAAPAKADNAAQKPAPGKKPEKAAPAGKTKKTAKAPKAAKGTQEVKAPVQPEAPPPAPVEAPRPQKEEQIVYLKLSDLHAFKNHPFQVRNDEEMRAMVSSVKDKGVTQPAIVRPREDGGYEIVSGHSRQKASELAGFTDMPCIIRNLTDEQAITQMVEDNMRKKRSKFG